MITIQSMPNLSAEEVLAAVDSPDRQYVARTPAIDVVRIDQLDGSCVLGVLGVSMQDMILIKIS